MAKATPFDPKAIYAGSNFSVEYMCAGAGKPGFLPSYPESSRTDANLKARCIVLSPDYVEVDAS
tara:strand:+ start:231 stop:422 length:192 start_codon:yes stop_codon:yes gene_type:complete